VGLSSKLTCKTTPAAAEGQNEDYQYEKEEEKEKANDKTGYLTSRP